MRNINKSIVAVVFICTSLFSGCSVENSYTDPIDTDEVLCYVELPPILDEVRPLAKQVVNVLDNKIERYEIDNIPDKYELDIVPILQLPELPTGCEITSLCMILNYHGFNVDKLELANKYLKIEGSYSEYTFDEAFIGSPYETWGWGCYAPVITDTANKYLKLQGSSLEAINITGSSIEQIKETVYSGIPVMVWSTIGLDTSHEEKTYWITPDGNKATFVQGEHCVVITGFNEETNKIIVLDPLIGRVEHNEQDFLKTYEKLHCQAVAIK